MTAAILPILRGMFAIAAAMLVFLAAPLYAQTSTASPTLSVDVNVVTLPVSVRDKKGQIIRNLTKDDFDLQENGKPESIRYFSQETDLPLTLGLLVDTSLSERNVLDQERTASKSFLDQMMTRPKDKAFLIHFDREVELLQDLTPSREKLESALQLLQLPQRNSDSDPDGNSRHTRGGATTLYDSVFLAANDVIKKQPGRKALIILSDGDDRGSKETLNTAIEAAQRADTVVYAIYFAEKHREGDRADFPSGGRRGGGGYPNGGGGYPGGGGGWPGGGGGGWPGGGGRRGGGREPEETHIAGKKVLEQMSRETGGRMYEVSKKESVDQIYSQIAEELRTQYMLGYTPDKANSGSGYRRIALTAKKKDLVVQTRDGYYADR